MSLENRYRALRIGIVAAAAAAATMVISPGEVSAQRGEAVKPSPKPEVTKPLVGSRATAFLVGAETLMGLGSAGLLILLARK